MASSTTPTPWPSDLLPPACSASSSSSSSSSSSFSSSAAAAPRSHSALSRLAAAGSASLNSSTSTLQPVLDHTISHDATSVLTLAVDEANSLVFSSGSQSECIYVWSYDTYVPIARLCGHSASILALELAPEKGWLFSASSDGTVRVWDTHTLVPLYVVQQPISDEEDTSIGDIFSLRWSKELQTLYMGCQNTSIRWIRLSRLPGSKHGDADASTSVHDTSAEQSNDSSLGFLPATALPIVRPHKFFDSGPSARGGASSSMSRSFSSSGAGTPMAHNQGGSSPGNQTPEIHFSPLKSQMQLQQQQQQGEDPRSFDTAFGAAMQPPEEPARYIQLAKASKVPNAHYGYIYTLTMLRLDEQRPVVLASGSGDEDVKLWCCSAQNKGQLELLATLSGSEGAVLALASWPGTLFAGKQGGQIDVWDLETFTLIRTLDAHSDDVLSLCATSSQDKNDATLLSSGADGFVNRYDHTFVRRDRWSAHRDAIVLSCALVNKSTELITGGSDQALRFWSVTPLGKGLSRTGMPLKYGFSSTTSTPSGGQTTSTSFDPLLVELSKFVSYQSVSSLDKHREDSRQCAHYLKSTLSSLGAHESSVIPGSAGRNPLVLSIFRARGPEGIRAPRKRVLFYGHYDVIAAQDADEWKSNPWTLTGQSGYLYGRGASDNKGPILSTATAVSRLSAAQRLDVDVVMLIEGEEESGSAGFKEALQREKSRIGKIDVVLLSNSYWIDEVTPCLTMGMRGVIQATVTISAAPAGDVADDQTLEVPGGGDRRRSSAATVASSGQFNGGEKKDLHSGVQGGAIREPMVDLVRLLGCLSSGERVLIPRFYDQVRAVTKDERLGYEKIVELLNQQQGSKAQGPDGSSARKPPPPSVDSLMSRWRFPSLSIHSVSVSGSGNSTVIPAVVTSRISLRLVPDQSLDVIKSSLIEYLQGKHIELNGYRNEVKVDVNHVADWWLGSAEDEYTKTLSKCISDVWSSKAGSVEPLRIREGGSIPTVAILEKELGNGVKAVHLPMGQSSDSAHLKDERIKLECLLKGREVVERWLEEIGRM